MNKPMLSFNISFMRLIKIFQQAVYNYAVKRGIGQYWIDANDIATEGLWVYSDGNRIVYRYIPLLQISEL